MDLNQVTISASDLYRAVQFYECLGLRMIVDSRPRYVRMIMPCGNATLSIHHRDHVTDDDSAPILYFESESLDHLVDNLQLSGVSFDQYPVDQRWGWREAHLKDPDGNRLILYYAAENRKNPPWRISAHAFTMHPYLRDWIFLPEKSKYTFGPKPSAATYCLKPIQDGIHATLNWTIDSQDSFAEYVMVLDGKQHKIDATRSIRCYFENGGIVSEQYKNNRMIARTIRNVILGGLLSVVLEHYPGNEESYTNIQIYRPLM